MPATSPSGLAPPNPASDPAAAARKCPKLEIALLECAWQNDDTKPALNLRRLTLKIVVQNKSVIRVEQVQVGIVGWTIREPLKNDHVITYVDARRPNIDMRGIGEWSPTLLVQRAKYDTAIRAFEHVELSDWSATLWVPCFIPHTESHDRTPFTHYRCAAFVASEASEPSWFQVEVAIARSGSDDADVSVEAACYQLPEGVRPLVTCALGEEARGTHLEASARIPFKLMPYSPPRAEIQVAGAPSSRPVGDLWTAPPTAHVALSRLEPLKARLALVLRPPGTIEWQLDVEVYVDLVKQITFPFHRARARIDLGRGLPPVTLEDLKATTGSSSANVTVTLDEVVLRNPSRLALSARSEAEAPPIATDITTVSIEVSLTEVGSSAPTVVSFIAVQSPDYPNVWSHPPDPPSTRHPPQVRG